MKNFTRLLSQIKTLIIGIVNIFQLILLTNSKFVELYMKESLLGTFGASKRFNQVNNITYSD